jgi:hypothetical protein
MIAAASPPKKVRQVRFENRLLESSLWRLDSWKRIKVVIHSAKKTITTRKFKALTIRIRQEGDKF